MRSPAPEATDAHPLRAGERWTELLKLDAARGAKPDRRQGRRVIRQVPGERTTWPSSLARAAEYDPTSSRRSSRSSRPCSRSTSPRQRRVEDSCDRSLGRLSRSSAIGVSAHRPRDRRAPAEGRGSGRAGRGGSSLTFQTWPLRRYSLLLLLEVERPGADAAEDGDLVARSRRRPGRGRALRRWPARRRSCGILHVAISCGVGRGLKPVVARRLGRGELHDAQAVLAVGQVGELAGVGDAELHVVQVVDAAAGVEDLVDPRLLGVRRCRRSPAPACPRRRRRRCGPRRCCGRPRVGSCVTGARLGQVGDVEHLDALLVADEGVAELHLHRRRVLRATSSPTTAVTCGLLRVVERRRRPGPRRSRRRRRCRRS